MKRGKEKGYDLDSHGVGYHSFHLDARPEIVDEFAPLYLLVCCLSFECRLLVSSRSSPLDVRGE